MTGIIGRSDALQMKCDDPECTHSAEDHEMFVNQTCHTHNGLRVTVMFGMLTVRCVVCNLPVIALKVDDKDIDGTILLDGDTIMVSFTSEKVFIKDGYNTDPEHHQVLWELPWRDE